MHRIRNSVPHIGQQGQIELTQRCFQNCAFCQSVIPTIFCLKHEDVGTMRSNRRSSGNAAGEASEVFNPIEALAGIVRQHRSEDDWNRLRAAIGLEDA